MTNFKMIVRADSAVLHAVPTRTPWKLSFKSSCSRSAMGRWFWGTLVPRLPRLPASWIKHLFPPTLSLEHWLLSNKQPNLSWVLTLASYRPGVPHSTARGHEGDALYEGIHHHGSRWLCHILCQEGHVALDWNREWQQGGPTCHFGGTSHSMGKRQSFQQWCWEN